MRICSFLPSATEIIYALGLGDELVGVTYECDYPPEAKTKPIVMTSETDNWNRAPSEISQLVSRRISEGLGLYRIDLDILKQAEADILVTQSICDVCSVNQSEVQEVAEKLRLNAKTISLDPHTLQDILQTILQVGRATGTEENAMRIVEQLQYEIQEVRARTSTSKDRPGVVCLDWLEPPIVAGHWVPEMVEYAGAIDLLGRAGKRSRTVSWKAIREASPDFLVLMPCGWNVRNILGYAERLRETPDWAQLRAVRSGNVFAVNANDYFSRPGPRIVKGLKILASIINPARFPFEPSEQTVMKLA